MNLVPSSSMVEPTASKPASAREVFTEAGSNARFRFDDSARLFSFTFAEGLAYEIGSNHIGAGGATLAIINNTPDYIGSYTLDVGEIASWNEMHQTFLPRYRFLRRPVLSGQNLEPIHKTNGQWLIRVVERNGKHCLTVFNDDSTPLSWPNNDKSSVEIWRLMLAGLTALSPLDRKVPGKHFQRSTFWCDGTARVVHSQLQNTSPKYQSRSIQFDGYTMRCRIRTSLLSQPIPWEGAHRSEYIVLGTCLLLAWVDYLAGSPSAFGSIVANSSKCSSVRQIELVTRNPAKRSLTSIQRYLPSTPPRERSLHEPRRPAALVPHAHGH